MRWARALRRSSLAVLGACVVAASAAAGAGSTFPPQLPASAQRIIERNWCSSASYAEARNAGGLSRAARRNLAQAEKVALAHPRGCRRAERAAPSGAEQVMPPGNCPTAPLALRTHALGHAAAA